MRKPLWLLAFFVGRSESEANKVARNPLRYARRLRTRLRESQNAEELAAECAKLEKRFNRGGKQFLKYIAKIRLPVTILFLCIGLALSAHAQTSSRLITPGVGWGPVVLGMTEPSARTTLQQLGEPHPCVGIGDLCYTGVEFAFYKSELVSITITDGTSVTREGIQVGSPLSAVLRAYGGTNEAVNTTLSGGLISEYCLRTFLGGTGMMSGGRWVYDYDRPDLLLFYDRRGIGFSFTTIRNGGPMPKVERIYINKPKGCVKAA